MASCFTCDICKRPIAQDKNDVCHLSIRGMTTPRTKTKSKERRFGLYLDLCPVCARGMFDAVDALSNPVLQ